jgi:hypothetical protein
MTNASSPPAHAPSIKAKIGELILGALATQSMSEARSDRIQTTNDSPSVTLGVILQKHSES